MMMMMIFLGDFLDKFRNDCVGAEPSLFTYAEGFKMRMQCIPLNPSAGT